MEQIFQTINSHVSKESLRAMAQTMDARGIAPVHSAMIRFKQAIASLRSVRQNLEVEMKNLQKQRCLSHKIIAQKSAVAMACNSKSILAKALVSYGILQNPTDYDSSHHPSMHIVSSCALCQKPAQVTMP